MYLPPILKPVSKKVQRTPKKRVMLPLEGMWMGSGSNLRQVLGRMSMDVGKGEAGKG